jgi:hypothetical protein
MSPILSLCVFIAERRIDGKTAVDMYYDEQTRTAFTLSQLTTNCFYFRFPIFLQTGSTRIYLRDRTYVYPRKTKQKSLQGDVTEGTHYPLHLFLHDSRVITASRCFSSYIAPFLLQRIKKRRFLLASSHRRRGKWFPGCGRHVCVPFCCCCCCCFPLPFLFDWRQSLIFFTSS